jgi:hypothetical protein
VLALDVAVVVGAVAAAVVPAGGEAAALSRVPEDDPLEEPPHAVSPKQASAIASAASAAVARPSKAIRDIDTSADCRLRAHYPIQKRILYAIALHEKSTWFTDNAP